MASRKHQILPLPPEVQAQIKSSIAITSLSDVVIELVKNSLDAQARAVYVDIDYLRGCCSVEDDGHGMSARELSEEGRLGSMYCKWHFRRVDATLTISIGTSKHNSQIETYGSRGRFISSLSALSLLSITSRHQGEAHEFTVSFYQSQIVARFRTSQEQQRTLQNTHGTKVTVRDLFGRLPVRVKHRAIQYELQENLDREFHHLKRRIVALLLAWSRPVKVVLSDTEKKRRRLLRLNLEFSLPGEWDSETDATAKLPFRLDWICPLLAQAGCIAHSSYASWVTASARTSTTSVRAAISLEPAPTRQVQFFSFDIRPVDPVHGSQVLFDEVNHLFALSSFGAVEDDIEISEDERSRRRKDRRYKSGEFTTRQLKGIAKGADRWPMFYIRINSSSEHPIPDEDQVHDSSAEAARVLHKVLQLLRTLIYQFLEEHHFRPRTRRRKRRKQDNEMPHRQKSFSDPIMHPPSNEASPQSAHATESMAHATTQPNKSKRPVTSQRFDSWSRVKSGKRDGFEHILSGLPRSKSLRDNPRPATAPAASSHVRNSKVDIGRMALAKSQLQPPLDDVVQLLLLQDLQNEGIFSDPDDEEVGDGNRRSIMSAMDAPINEEEDVTPYDSLPPDETILWTNPTTGAVVHFNSRTGLIMPDSQEQDNDHQTSEAEHSTGLLTRTNLAPLSKFISSVRPAPKILESRMHVAPDSWIRDLLKGSGNSVFRQLEEAIPSVAPEEAITNGDVASCCHGKFGNERLKQVSALFDVASEGSRGRLSKSGLADAQVLAQVDRKFILVKVTTGQILARINKANGQPLPEETLLVLIDQHAADERCQVEALYEELCDMETVQLLKPMHFEVPAQEFRLFQLQKAFFAGWGFRYDMQTGPAHGALRPASRRREYRPTSGRPEDVCSIVVTALPNLIAERCRLDSKILIDFLRSEVWARFEDSSTNSTIRFTREESDFGQSDSGGYCGNQKRWLSKISSCPKGLIEMLNSRACRSAIMFNDILSIEECKALVKRLVKCSFPFQCAHGRPSMVALGGLGTADARHGRPLEPGTEQEDVEGGGDFAKAFDSWQAKI